MADTKKYSEREMVEAWALVRPVLIVESDKRQKYSREEIAAMDYMIEALDARLETGAAE